MVDRAGCKVPDADRSQDARLSEQIAQWSDFIYRREQSKIVSIMNLHYNKNDEWALIVIMQIDRQQTPQPNYLLERNFDFM